ncbi:MAG: CBS domain-containing protein [Alphaproteobacteria bacterium]|nr:CBS domain-containing protein [Alphaproteobacteria bacterium]
MLVKECMSSKIETVAPDTPLQECARKMRDLDIGSLPVWEDGKLAGMVTDRDICCRAVADGRDIAATFAGDVMSRDVACCFDDHDYEDAAHMMEDKHLRRLAVMDRENRMVGILTVDDLARHSYILAGEVLRAVAPTAH